MHNFLTEAMLLFSNENAFDPKISRLCVQKKSQSESGRSAKQSTKLNLSRLFQGWNSLDKNPNVSFQILL